MTTILGQALDLIGRADGDSAQAVGRAYHEALAPYGLKASFARAYGTQRFSEHVYARVSPPGWEELYAREKMHERNFLVREARQRSAAFAWSKVITQDDSWMWRILLDNGYQDGIGIPCHGPGGYMGVISLGFTRLDQLSPDEHSAIAVASLIVHERMRTLSPVPTIAQPSLSGRERDCIAFVAEGKSDWEIGVILSISQTTVHTHVENAKRKLGARTRAQAAARAVSLGLI